MNLSKYEELFIRSHFSQSNKKVRIMAWIIVVLTTPLAVLIISTLIKNSHDRSLLFIGIIGLTIPIILIRYLFAVSPKKVNDFPLTKEEISGKFRLIRYGFRIQYTACYIGDHRVVFLDNWHEKHHINDGDYLKAWGIPLREKENKPDLIYVILSIEGQYQLIKNIPSL